MTPPQLTKMGRYDLTRCWGSMLSLVPELLVNIAHIGKVNEDKLAHSRIQLRTLGVKYGKYPRASLAQTMARWSRGRMAGRSNGSRRATLAALQLLPMSALQRIANSSRTLRHVRKVPWHLYGAIGVKAVVSEHLLVRLGCDISNVLT